MNRLHHLILTSLLLSLSACEEPAEPAQPAPPPKITTDRFGRTAELSDIPEALTKKELQFHLRTNLSASDLQAQVAKRGLAEPLDPQEMTELTALGASKELLDLISNPSLILTQEEYELYQKRVGARKKRSEQINAQEDSSRESRRADLNSTLYSLNRGQLNDELEKLREKKQKLFADRSKTQYSRSPNTPYQLLSIEISNIDKEISAVNKRLEEQQRSR
jgi:hypothetical protein